jgi:hypothetical protein
LRFNVIPEFAATKAVLSSGLSLVCLSVLLTAACSKDEKAAAEPGAPAGQEEMP